MQRFCHWLMCNLNLRMYRYGAAHAFSLVQRLFKLLRPISAPPVDWPRVCESKKAMSLQRADHRESVVRTFFEISSGIEIDSPNFCYFKLLDVCLGQMGRNAAMQHQYEMRFCISMVHVFDCDAKTRAATSLSCKFACPMPETASFFDE